MKKAIFLVLFCLSLSSLFSQSSRWRLLLPVPTFDVAVNPYNINTIFVGGEGNLIYRSFDAGQTWDTLVIFAKMQSSRLNNVIILPTDTNIVLVGGLNFGNIVRSTDYGNTWKVVLAKDHAIDLNGKAMLYKPDEPNIIYAGDFKWGVIYRSTNNGATWDSLTKIPTEICSIGIREDSTNVILAGSIYGQIFVSQDTGHTWVLCDSLRVPKHLQQDVEITRIEFSKRDPRVGYAVVTYLFALNKNNGGLHRTTDGGYNWDIIGFPDTSIWALSVKSRGDKDEIFIGGYTEDFWTLDTNLVPGVGIVRISTDGGETWLNFDERIDWVLYDLKANSDLFVIQSIGDTLYAAGDYGIFRISYNGGNSFSNQNLDTRDNIRGMHFLNKRNGFLCGQNGVIFRTTNGGFSWNQVKIPTNSNLNGIFFVDTLKGFVVGEKSTIYKTTDGGKTWLDLGIDYACDFYGIKKFYNYLVIFGNRGTILVSQDNGENWTKISGVPNEEITGIEITKNGTVFIATLNGNLYYSNDFQNYKLKFSDHTLRLTAIKFVDNNVGFITTNRPYFFETRDGGNSWNKVKTITLRGMNAIETKGDTVYFCGKYATILRSTNKGVEWGVRTGGSGPRANVWRAYYYENQGKEQLFMATEAGLFVLDYPLTYKENIAFQSDVLKVFVLPGKNSLFVNYKLQEQVSNKISLNIYNTLGQIIFSSQLYPMNKSFQDFVILPFVLPTGVYFVQIIENQRSNVTKIVVD
ncbi:MAG: YCF48-related protein [Ignavibacteria bacterium]|nr:YCF48-related protein [Ignavibacteria bacterium]